MKLIFENTDIMYLSQPERANLIIDMWLDLYNSRTISKKQAMDYFEKRGYDCYGYTDEQFNDDYDLAADEWDNRFGIDEPDDDLDNIKTKEDAARWLDSMLNKFGDTYHFPSAVRFDFAKLIDKFGVPYFWRR